MPGVELRLGSLGSLDAAPRLPGGAEGATCTRTRASSPRTCASGSTINPLRAFDSDDEGTRGGDGERADDRRARSRARTPSTSPRCGRCSTRPGSPTRSTRPWSAASTTTRGRSSPSSATRLGAQSEIGGGGRYDGLIEQLGGPPTPAVGWAAGIERILLALGEEEAERRARRLRRRSPTTGSGRGRWRWPAELRRAGLSAEVDLAGRGLKGQLKHAEPDRRPPRR